MNDLEKAFLAGLTLKAFRATQKSKTEEPVTEPDKTEENDQKPAFDEDYDPWD